MISVEEIRHAAGEFTEVAQTEVGKDFTIAEAGQLLVPTFDEFALIMGLDSAANAHAMDKSTIVKNELKIQALGGLRVIVGRLVRVNGVDQGIFYPGIILDGPDERLAISVMDTVVDRTRDVKDLAQFSDIQQLVLAGQLASSAPNAADHVSQDHADSDVSNESDDSDMINLTDVAHGQLIAVYQGSDNLHDVVHQVTDAGKLGTTVSKSTAIVNEHKERPTNTLKLGLHDISAIIVTKQNQAPLPLSNSAFELSTGFAAAAISTQLPKGHLTERIKQNVGRLVEL